MYNILVGNSRAKIRFFFPREKHITTMIWGKN